MLKVLLSHLRCLLHVQDFIPSSFSSPFVRPKHHSQPTVIISHHSHSSRYHCISGENTNRSIAHQPALSDDSLAQIMAIDSVFPAFRRPPAYPAMTAQPEFLAEFPTRPPSYTTMSEDDLRAAIEGIHRSIMRAENNRSSWRQTKAVSKDDDGSFSSADCWGLINTTIFSFILCFCIFIFVRYPYRC